MDKYGSTIRMLATGPGTLEDRHGRVDLEEMERMVKNREQALGRDK